jgi:hypothetical protein
MKLIANDSGQSLQLFLADEIRPLKGVHFPEFVEKIASRYRFASVPTDVVEALNSGATKFANGILPDHPGTVIRSLEIYNDGIIVNAFDTETADTVIDDMFRWAVDTFGFRSPKTIKNRIYFSAVVIQFEESLNSVLQQFEILKQTAANAFEATSGISADFDLSTVGLQADPEKLPAGLGTRFVIERRFGRPFSDNVYFSTAPIPTKAHLKWLEEFEGALQAVS